MTKPKELDSILTALNSTNMFKYPIGNKELTLKTRELESNGIIYYSPLESSTFIRYQQNY
jgi:hypothetical protein